MGLELLQSEGAPITLPPHHPPLEEPRQHSRPTLSLLQAFCTSTASHIEVRAPRFSQEAYHGCSLTWFSTISPIRSHNSLAVAWRLSTYRAATTSRTAAAASARLRYLIPDTDTWRIFNDCLLSGHVRYLSINARIQKGGVDRRGALAGRCGPREAALPNPVQPTKSNARTQLSSTSDAD